MTSLAAISAETAKGDVVPLSAVATPAGVPSIAAIKQAVAALNAMLGLIRGTKFEGASRVQGRLDVVRRLLSEAFGEQPQATARGRDGVATEWLVSPDGSWSCIEIIGDTATIVAGGDGWETA